MAPIPVHALCLAASLPFLGPRPTPAAPQGAATFQETGPVLPQRPNLLLLVLDDVGVDLLGAYGEGPTVPACTPFLDSLAAGGLLFRNAWTDPVCSPTRSQLLTGRHGFRTGVGDAISSTAGVSGLSTDELTIAELLSGAGYACGAFGKWHLAASNLNPADPLRHGFVWFEGAIGGTLGPTEVGQSCGGCPTGCDEGQLGYERWVKSINGVETCEFRYATTVTTDDTLAAAGTVLAEPWFLYVSYNAIHTPLHDPPASLCTGGPGCTCPGPHGTGPDQARTMLEALDREIGRLVAGLHATTRGPIVVVLIGDNGTSSEVAEGAPGSCFDPQRSKGSPYEGGINVPLIVSGPGIPAGEVTGLVSSTDLFATFADLAGLASSAEDSRSLVPYLLAPETSVRNFVYAERFAPNGLPFAPAWHVRTVRDGRYKLIRRTGLSDEFYDLLADPCESVDLFPPAAGSPEEAAWAALNRRLSEMGVGEG